jgi:hypothetical protein
MLLAYREDGSSFAVAGAIGVHHQTVQRCVERALALALRAIVTPLAGQTTRAIAIVLNDRGIPTPRGGQWQLPQVMRLLERLGL